MSFEPGTEFGTEDEDDTIVAVSDVHGYLGEEEVDNGAYQLLEEAADSEHVQDNQLVSRKKTAEGYEYNLEAENTTIVFNGDMIDRGPESEEALNMVFDLLDDAEDQGRSDSVQYLMGNHEHFLATPEIQRGPGLTDSDYDEDGDWWHFAGQHEYEKGQNYRKEFLDRLADGQVKAVFEGFNFDYVHAGSNGKLKPEILNNKLKEVGEKLKNAYEEGNEKYRQIQEDINSDERYDKLLSNDLSDNRGRGPDSGILWMDFEFMSDESPRQVVGHTRRHSGEMKGNALNINSIRDYQKGELNLMASIETEEGLHTFDYNPDFDLIENHETTVWEAEEPEDAFGDLGSETEETVSFDLDEDQEGSEPSPGTDSDDSPFDFSTEASPTSDSSQPEQPPKPEGSRDRDDADGSNTDSGNRFISFISSLVDSDEDELKPPEGRREAKDYYSEDPDSNDRKRSR